LPIDPDNRVRFELMGLERVRIALVRGFDIPGGPMREDALYWVKEQGHLLSEAPHLDARFRAFLAEV
jgi:hypothetical protein